MENTTFLVPMQTSMPVLKSDKKKPSSALAKQAFYRLHQQINTLQTKIQNVEQQCEKHLHFYHTQIKPKEEELCTLIETFLLRARHVLQTKNILSKKQYKFMQDLLEKDFRLLLNIQKDLRGSKELEAFYEEVHGISLQQVQKNTLADILKEEGLSQEDIDDFDFTQNLEETMADIFKTLQEKEESSDHVPPPAAPKTPKQLQQEEKAKQLEALQNKSISTIYKQLVKELHPDLEQDAEKKTEKDLIMKRLTSAYESRDLLAMLELEAEHLGNIHKDIDTIDEATLGIYNTLLKQQVQELKKQVKLVLLRPRYFDIAHFAHDNTKNLAEELQFALMEVSTLISDYTTKIHDLSGPSPIQDLKYILSDLIQRENAPKQALDMEEMMEDLEDMFKELLSFTAPLKKKKKPKKPTSKK